MSLAKITLQGLEIFLNYENKSLFDLLTVPEGIVKNDLVDNIMLECGEFETLYADPDFMRSAIGAWSNKHQRTFLKWVNALNIEYSPLENYDRQENWTDETDANTTNTLNSTVDSSSTSGGESKTNIAAYDSSNYSPSDQVTDSNTASNTSTDASTGAGTENIDFEHTGRIHGNIGVTTSQQMLEQELEVARFNIVDEITKLFMSELCIAVYD
jgi:hypothetical protein